MFSKDDAVRLRESLQPMVFGGSAQLTPTLQAYCDFYGLHFGGQQLAVQHSIGRFACDEFQLVCQYFQVPLHQQRGTAFIIHGYFDHVGLYSHLIDHCLRAGYSVVIFDLPGHGLSSGKEASIGGFGQYVKSLMSCLELAEQQRVHQPWLLIGQSTGGAVIIDGLIEHGLAQRFSITSFLVLAPLLRPYKWFRSNLLFQSTRWFLSASRRTFARNSHDEEFLNFIRYHDGLQSQLLRRDWVQAMFDFQKRFRRFPVSNQVLHIIQGSGDGTVDWRYNLPRLREKFPKSCCYMVTDAGHHLVNEAQPYRDRVFSLIDQILGKEVQ